MIFQHFEDIGEIFSEFAVMILTNYMMNVITKSKNKTRIIHILSTDCIISKKSMKLKLNTTLKCWISQYQ